MADCDSGSDRSINYVINDKDEKTFIFDCRCCGGDGL